MTVEIRMLGPPEIASLDGPVALRPQSLHLLGLLVAANDWVASDVLIDDLWPDNTPTSPKASLHVAVKRLRSTLDDTDQLIIETNAFGYRIAPGADVDVWTWTKLLSAAHATTEPDAKMDLFERAESLWRGPPYATVRNSILLEREQQRLAQHHDDIVVAHARMLTRSGNPGAAVHKLDARPAERSANEDAAVARLEAFGAANRADDGLRDAAEFRRHLREHAGLSPSNAFDEAERRLLGGTTFNEQPVAGSLEIEPDELTWRRELLESTHARLERLINADRGAAIRVIAPARFGLSRFVDEVVGRAVRERPGIVVERVPPVGSLTTLRSALADVSVPPATDQRSEHLEVLRRHLTASEVADVDESAMRIVVIDDAHDLDRWSRDLLDTAASIRLPAGYVLIVATHDGDAVAMRSAVSVHLGALDRAEISEMLRTTSPDLREHTVERTSARVLTWTNGEPLSVIASLDAIAADGPDATLPVGVSADERIHERLDALDEAARRTVTELAVIALQIDLDAAAPILDHAAPVIEEHLARAATVGLVAQSADGWSFVSPPIRHVLATDVAPSRCRSIHIAAARWFDDHGGVVPAAGHLTSALDLTEPDDSSDDHTRLLEMALDALDRASHDSVESRDFGEAARLAGRLGDLTDDDGLRRTARARRAHALDLAGRHRAANDLLNTLFDEAIGVDDLELACELALAGSGGASRVGGLPDRRRRLRRASERINSLHPRHDEVVAEFALELVASQRPLDEDLRGELSRISSDGGIRSSLLARRVTLADDERRVGGMLDDAIALVSDLSVVGTTGHSDAFAESACLSVAVHVAMTAGDLDRAESWIDDLAGIGDRSGDARALWQSRAFRAAIFEARGLSKDSDREIDAAREIALRLEMPDGVSSWLLHHLGRAFRSGSLAAVATGLEDAAERYRLPVWYALRALAQFDLGNEAAAGDLLRLTIDSMDGSIDTFAAPAAAVATLTAARLGRPESMIACANRLRPRRGRQLFLGYGGPYLGPVDWYLAHGARAAGDDRLASHLEHEALTACNSIGARVWLTAGLRTSD